MEKKETPELIGREAFGGSDIFKVQSQHERFLREIEHLPEEKKVEEFTNAVKYLLKYKSYYWLELAHLIDFLMTKDEANGKERFKIIAPDLTKTQFCEKYLGMARNTVNAYLKIIRNYSDYGFTEEQIRVLGFGNTREILRMVPMGTISELSNRTLEELKKLTRANIRGESKKTKPTIERLKNDWKQASEKEKEEFLRYIHGSGKDTSMD